MTTYLEIEKSVSNKTLMEESLIGLMSEERCPNCGFRLYINSICNIWCPECFFKENISCKHRNRRNEDWPDGSIQVCNDCGMSRHIWEQGASDWIMIKNLPKARKEMQKSIDRIIKTVKRNK